MIKCQACGTQNLDSSQYCDECGDSLQKYQAPERVPEEKEPPKSSENEGQPVFQAANVTSVGIPLIPDSQKEGVAEVEKGTSLDAVKSDKKPTSEHAKLVIERGGAIGTEFPLASDESNIGRWDADNGIFPDVDLDSHDPEAKVSRKHARIRLKGEQYFLEDLGSTNGTFVNRGRRLIPGSPHQVKEGDEIIVGKTFLRFHIT